MLSSCCISMFPPTMPPLASSFDPPSPACMFMFRYPLLSIESLPDDLRLVVDHTVFPITLLMFTITSKRDKLTANSTIVSQSLMACFVVPGLLPAALSASAR